MVKSQLAAVVSRHNRKVKNNGNKTADRLLEIAKDQISFLPSKTIVAETKILEREMNYSFLKDYQIIFAAIFLSFIFMFGFRHIAQQIPNMNNAPYHMALPSAPKVELLPSASLTAYSEFSPMPVISEDHFFKLPLQLQQTVIAFSSFSTLQEVYTLMSSKYKKLFWSCLPRELQALSEGQLLRQVSMIQDLEKCPGWQILSNDVHVFVQRNPQLIDTFHADLKYYFEVNQGRRNAQAS